MDVTDSLSAPAAARARQVDPALRTVYPRLLAFAHRLLHQRGVRDLEAEDLCQDGVMLALRCVYRFPDGRLDDLDRDALAAILYAVANRAMRGRVIDHIRRADHQRRSRHLVSAPEDLDSSFEDGQAARATLDDMLAHTSPPARRVLQAAAADGDVDVAKIVERTGFSRPYVYRLLQTLAEAGAET